MGDMMNYKKMIRGVLAALTVLVCLCGGLKMNASASEASGAGADGVAGESAGGAAENSSDAVGSESSAAETDTATAETTAPDAGLTDDEVIPEGVYINETPVGGMTIAEAEAMLAAMEAEISTAVFTLTRGEEVLEIPFVELGLKFEDTTYLLEKTTNIGKTGMLVERYKALKDFENDKLVCTWGYSFDQKLLEEKVLAYGESIAVEPVDSTLTLSELVMTASESVNGISMDTEATLENVRAAVAGWAGQSVTAEAVIIETAPKYTYEELSKVKDIMADFVTPMGGIIDEGRGLNVVRGAELINGTILLPGESFSAHAALTPFTLENGYTYATAFNDRGYVDSIGGGVCSLTTTLYNAIMYAELQVDRRYNHSMVINYARPGLDSTVNDDGSKDLVFTNNYDFPIYIEARAWSECEEAGQCYFAIWGVRTEEMKKRDISLYYEVIEYEGAVMNYEVDPELEPGEVVIDQAAYPRMVVKAYKKVEVDGVVVEDIYLHTDYYERSDGKARHNPIEESTDESMGGETGENPDGTQPGETEPGGTVNPGETGGAVNPGETGGAVNPDGTTESSGEAGTTEPSGETEVTEPSGEAGTTETSGEAGTTEGSGEAGATAVSGENGEQESAGGEAAGAQESSPVAE